MQGVRHGDVGLGARGDREFEGVARARSSSNSDPDIEPRALEANVELSIAYRTSRRSPA